MATRPKTLDEFQGQSNKDVAERLRVAISSAKKRGVVLSHVLLYGQAGTGKTTLANVIAEELGAKCVTRTGGSIGSQKDIFIAMHEVDTLQEQGHDVVFFLDEIHKLAAKDMPEELFYSILEDFIFFSGLAGVKVTLNGEQHMITHNALKTRKPLTFIGATTSPGLLNKPLRDRFAIHCYLREYSTDDLASIIRFHSDKEGIKIESDAALDIAKRARGVPRVAVNFLKSCRDRAIYKDKEVLDKESVAEEMLLQGIAEDGLTKMDIKVLQTLSANPKGMGLQNLSGSSGFDKSTLEEMVLPFLQYRGFTVTTSKRFITPLGIERLKNV